MITDFISSLRSICPCPIGKVWRFFHSVMFYKYDPFWFLFLCIMWTKDMSSIHIDSLFFYRYLLETMFSPETYVSAFIKNQFSVCLSLFLDSIFLILWSICPSLCQYHTVFHYSSFILSLKVRLCKSCNFVLIFEQ